ncbi:MAG: GDP-mannose 4,6-dehydratase, partial [Gammaproteobacteria bacterium]|nr:GDP-mannose 4,6-dehydratase [Gammaproteobacteria bacterium]
MTPPSTINHQLSTNTFFQGKKVLLTGHTGFKGGWLTLWLQRLGAQVTGISLPPDTTPNLFSMARVADGIDSQFVDIRNLDALHALLRTIQPEIVFHLAAQSLVRAGYRA